MLAVRCGNYRRRPLIVARNYTGEMVILSMFIVAGTISEFLDIGAATIPEFSIINEINFKYFFFITPFYQMDKR